MDLSDLFQQCRAYTAVLSTIDLLAKEPAVYAFYDLLSFNEAKMIADVDRMKTLHGRGLDLRNDNLPHSFQIQLRGNAKPFAGSGRTLCESVDPTKRPALCRTLLFLSFLNEPLYIGKTNNLQTRFRAHHDKDFLYKMKDKFKRPADEFLMFAYMCSDDDSRLLESILIQIINPPFNDQKT